MAELRCYHHCNCEDRPAVARCSVCGKGLCRECADKLTSPNTGKLLCADCLNAEIASDESWAISRRNRMKSEALTIALGFAIGLVTEIVLLSLAIKNGLDSIAGILFVLSLFLFLPTLLASFGTIVGTVRRVFHNFLLRIIFFFILVVASPIMFIVRLVRRSRNAKAMKRFADAQKMKREAIAAYKEAAEKMHTRPETQEEFERRIKAQYSELLVRNKEAAEEALTAERAKYETQLKDYRKQMDDMATSAEQQRKASEQIRQAKEEIERNEAIAHKKAKAHQRRRDRV